MNAFQENPWWYHVLTRDDAPPVFLKQGEAFRIGRHRTCELCISSRKASRFHARIDWAGSQPRLVDLNSNNGCFVNEERVKAEPLRDGDEVRIATFTAQYRRVHDLSELDFDKEDGALSTAGMNGMFSGYLQQTSGIEVLTKLRTDSKTGVLSFLPRSGEIGVLDGQPMWAKTPELEGEEALLSLMLLKNGMFVFSLQDNSQQTRNIQRTLAELLRSTIEKSVSSKRDSGQDAKDKPTIALDPTGLQLIDDESPAKKEENSRAYIASEHTTVVVKPEEKRSSVENVSVNDYQSTLVDGHDASADQE